MPAPLESVNNRLTAIQSQISRLEHELNEIVAARHIDADENATLQAVNDLQNDLRKNFDAQYEELRKSLQTMAADFAGVHRQMAEEIHSLRDLLIRAMSDGQYFSMVPSGPFIRRLFHENAHEKIQVARHAAGKIFTRKGLAQRCFIQSSSIAYHLLHSVDSEASIDGSWLIYTNSAVAQIPMLFGRTISRHSIWPFRGHTFDNACGGWLIPPNDQPSVDALRELFRRSVDPLEIAIITPRYVCPDIVFFEREEGAFLANEIAREAKHVYILTVGDRVFPSQTSLPSGLTLTPALESLLRDTPQKVSVISSWPNHEVPQAAYMLAKRVGEVDWQSKRGWNQVLC